MATMTDIAREAGVSLSTVSYALSGKRPISDATRARIQSAIDRLEYHPAAAARALATQRTSLLGVAVPRHERVDDHVIMEFVGSILTAAHAHDNDILLVAAEDHARTLKVVEEGKVDAMIVMDLVEEDPRLPALARLPRPVVLIGYPQDSAGLACVDFDFLSGTMLAVRELSRRGAERIALLVPPQRPDGPVPTYARRARLGYDLACRELGLAPLLVETGHTQEEVDAAVAEELAEADGLIVHHERALPPLTRTLAARGTRVPEDLQLIAIAPRDVARSGTAEISSVDLPIPAIGRTAVTMVLELLGASEVPPHSRLLSPSFTARANTPAL
jgi:DNA-binding LacI/PurR family transcriptional regulator